MHNLDSARSNFPNSNGTSAGFSYRKATNAEAEKPKMTFFHQVEEHEEDSERSSQKHENSEKNFKTESNYIDYAQDKPYALGQRPSRHSNQNQTNASSFLPNQPRSVSYNPNDKLPPSSTQPRAYFNPLNMGVSTTVASFPP